MGKYKYMELTPTQLKLIELIVSEEKSITEATNEVGISRTSYYDYIKNPVFKQAMDEAIELKVKEARKHIKINVNKYLKQLDNLSEKGKNEAARVNALKTLLTMGELDPSTKQEVTVKNDESEQKNVLLDMLKEKSEDGE